MTMPRYSKHQRGVALIEVLMAVLIFSVGILGLVGLQSRAIQLSMDTEDRNRAALLANELVNEMWLRRAPTVPADVVTAWKAKVAATTQSGLPGGEGEYSVTGHQADVTIKWQSPGASAKSQLTTRVVLP